MVISGIAEQVPERIGRWIYLDAFVANGESVNSILGAAWDEMIKPLIKNGFISPFSPTETNPRTGISQPSKTFTETLKIDDSLAANSFMLYFDGKKWGGWLCRVGSKPS